MTLEEQVEGENMRLTSERKISPCKRKKCPYFGTYHSECQFCEWNKNRVWTALKTK